MSGILNKKRVVYTDPMWAVNEDGRLDNGRAASEQEILGPGVEIDLGLYEDGAFVKDGQRFLDHLKGADAVVIYRAVVTPEMVEAVKPTCKVVARQGVGFDNLNAPLLRQHGLFGFNVPDYCVDEASTHAVTLALSLERHLCVQNDRLKDGTWNIFEGGYPRRLNDLTAGIVGFGRIGRAVARKLQAFYGDIIAYDPYIHGDQMRGYGVGKQDSLEGLLGAADLVMMHCELNEETKFIIDRQSITAMRPDAFLVNGARGNLVEPEAVLQALSTDAIGGYASDVFSPEDPNEHPINKQILAYDNVIVTSHRAFLSTPAEVSQRRRVAEEVARVLNDGQPPLFGRLA